MCILDITPETTGRELKQQIKKGQPWDKVTCSTTVVEVVVGDQLLGNDEQVADVGLIDADPVIVVFKENRVRCSHKGEIADLGSEIDSELLLVAEIPCHGTQISARAFEQ